MDAESLFLRFRETREPAPLGEVFDLVAADLFAVALHLGRDRAEAEDLVQATFVVAIERASRYDAAHPLRPWLLGILHREAKVLRRRVRRTPDPARVAAPVDAPPLQRALAAEAVDAVATAIRQVPQPYRGVLELRFVQACGHDEIAARLQRSPGAVRTQLWRGLELLRALLPKGLAVALAAEVSLEPGLAAVRARVLEAASSKAVLAGAAGIAGGLLMHKLSVGVAAAVLVVAGFWFWPRPAAETSLQATAPDGPAATAAVPRPEAGRFAKDAVDRALVADGAPRVASPADAAAAPAPVTVRAVVVDVDGDPVVDAEVALFEPKPRRDAAGSPEPAWVRLPGEPFWRAHTDVAGRTQFVLDREAFVAAKKDGTGITGDLRVEPRQRELQHELRLVLRPEVRLVGHVLLPGGEPASGARVDVWKSSYPEWNLAEAPPAVVTGDDGRFVFSVVAGIDWSVRATLGKRSASTRVEDSSTEPVREITLQLPGAFSMRGVLLGVDGKPVAGEVRLLSEPMRLGHDPRFTRAKTDAEGRFELLLTAGGSFELVGGTEGQTAAHVPVVLDDARPHQEVALRLSRFVVVAGRALDERGEPCGGVFVGMSPVVERTNLHTCLVEVQGSFAQGPTAADGTFRFLVPAGCRYRIVYRASPHLWAQGPEVQAPTEDALLIVREADKQGFVVAGRVVAAATGAPVPAFRVHLVTHSPDGGHSDTQLAQGRDGAFTADPVPVGRRYTLRVEADGFGDAELGPFDATVRREEVTARLPALGSLVCTVLRADGTPAVKAHVGIERLGEHPFAATPQGATDHEGRIRFTGLVPDEYHVGAYAAVVAVTAGAAANGTVVVPAGAEATLVLSLPK